MNLILSLKMVCSRSIIDSCQKSHDQSETAEDEKNSFPKMFLDFIEICGVWVSVVTQFTAFEFSLTLPGNYVLV